MRIIAETRNFCVAHSENLRSALAVLDAGGAQVIFVEDKARKLVGIVTDGDIRRFLLRGGTMEASAIEAANTDYVYLTEDKASQAKQLLAKNKKINHIPIVNDAGELTAFACRKNIFPQGLLSSDLPVVIMAGGKGERLLPLTNIIPKPLMPVGEKTIIERVMDSFLDRGAQKFVCLINHKKEIIRAYFKDIEHAYDIEFREEKTFLGTAGGLKLLQGQIDQSFILTNCDILAQFDLHAIMSWHNKNGATITVLGVQMSTVIPYGVVELDQDGCVLGLEEKPRYSHIVLSGIYVVSPVIFEFIGQEEVLGMDELICRLIDKGEKVACYPIGDNWLDMGQLDEYRNMLRKLGIQP